MEVGHRLCKRTPPGVGVLANFYHYRLLQDKCVGDPIPYNRLVYLAAEKLKYSLSSD